MMNATPVTYTTTILAAALIFVTLFTVSCARKNEKGAIPKSSEPVPVTIMALARTEHPLVITASGQLTTDDETVLAFKTGGVVSAVFVKEGDRIKKGQLLATLDLTEIDALVAQARNGYEKAERDFQRVTNLFGDSVATLEQLQNARTGFAVAGEQLEAARFNRTFCEIHAPAGGYVLHKFVNAGQVVGGGSPVLITNGAAQGKWILKAGVSDRQWAMLETGDTAEVHVDAFPGHVIGAHVIRKSKRADRQSGAFTVELAVHDNKMALATGMFAYADVTSRASSAAWSVPHEAVLDANDDQGFVFITNDNRTAIRQAVTIESFDDQAVRISRGLERAGALIISGSAYLTDGAPLQIIK